MRNRKRLALWLAAAAVLFVGVSLPAWAGDGSNGVYGGFVGSDQWFRDMGQAARDREMLKSLSPQSGATSSGMRPGCRPVDVGRKPGCLPPNYVNVSGRIVFPHGNPFPDKQLPDLEIQARNKKADPVERSPFIDQNGNFHTVFMRGQTYDLYWVYYLGSREKFASVYVPPKGPSKRTLVVDYTPHPQKAANAAAPPPTSAAYTPPSTTKYVAPHAGPGFVAPHVGPGFVAPHVGPGFVPPGSK